MIIANVAVDEPAKASTTNAVINHANAANGRAIYTSNSAWSVPNGVHRATVYIAGCGGTGFSSEISPDYPGGMSPLVSKVISDLVEGESYNVVIGTTSNSGDSIFGVDLVRSNRGGDSEGAGVGAAGTHNGEIVHNNSMFIADINSQVGYGSNNGIYAGVQGICVIVW